MKWYNHRVSDGRTGLLRIERRYIRAALLLFSLALVTVVSAGEPAEKPHGCDDKDGALFTGSNASDEACEMADSERLPYWNPSTTQDRMEEDQHEE